MKTSKNVVLLILLLLLSATGLFASQGFEVSFNQPVSSEYDLEFELGDYRLSETQKNDKMFIEIDFASSVVTSKKGFAALPYIHASVQISLDRNVTTQIVSSDYVEYQLDHPLVPSRGIIYRNQDPSTIPYEIARESIVDEFYPVNVTQTTEPYILRDIRGVNVYVYPFQYNAAQNILRVYTNVTVKLTDNNTMPINPITSFSLTIMRDMHHMYSTIFINYDRTRFENELADFGSILVIHTPRDATAILPYIEWKREKGHTVYVEEVATGTNVISLVSSQYTIHNDILYVQLVGDWADIQGPTSGGAAADPNLGCVVGGDAYPDMIVGRFSSNSAAHVTTQVDKSITYERDPDMGADWYSAAIGIASSQGPGDDGELDYEHIQNIYDNKLDPFTYDTHTPIYDPSANATMVANAVNTGASIINYCGHGSTTSWGSSGFNNTHVNLLTNGEKLPFIISVACVNGNFQNYECFAEAWLKKDGGGAVGMYAATINQSWDPPMRGQDYISDLLIGGYDYALYPGQNGITTDVQKTTYGAMCFNGSILMAMEEYGGGQPMLETWHVFGDASLQVRTDTPAEIILSNNVVLMGVDFTTTITSGGSPVVGAFVTLYQDDIAYSGATDLNGSVTISHSLIAGDAKMIITGFNIETIYDDITVIPTGGPYVLFDSYTLDDTAGNGNGLMDYGEFILLTLSMENVGIDQADNVTVTLSTDDQYITITDDTEFYGNIAAGAVVTIDDGFAVEVCDSIPDEHMFLFQVSATDGTNTWLSNFVIEAYAPVLWAGEMTIDDASGNNNGVLDPGETVTITIPTYNDGHAPSPEAIADLSCANQLITIEQSPVNLGEIGSQSFEDAVYTVTASDEITFGTPVTFIYNVVAGEYIVTRNYDISVGIFIEDFESGGFTNFPWEFVGCNITWPNINPIEDFTIIDTIPDINWSIATDSFYSGAASAKSYPITHNQASFMNVSVNVATDGEISFYYRVACEYSPSQTYFYDGLIFFIDDVEAGRYQPEPDGSSPWTYASYPVTSGTHTFTWVYVKDSSDGSTALPEDCAWVDYIVFPTLSLINGTIAGQVTLLPAGNIEDVMISTYYGSTSPDASGYYSFISPVGIFDVAASLAGYETITVYDVEVFEEQTTTVDFVLCYLAPPIDLEGELNDCYVSLSWEQSESSTRDFQHYNIYRNIDSGAFTILDTTLALAYVDSLFESGDYGYYVTAEYSQNDESDPTNTVIISYVQSDAGNELIPVVTKLNGNFPNPFNPETTISFSLAQDTKNAKITIYNIKGQKVKQIVSGQLSAGQHSMIWNGRDSNEKPVSSGIYFYRMRTDGYDKTKRMLLLK